MKDTRMMSIAATVPPIGSVFPKGWPPNSTAIDFPGSRFWKFLENGGRQRCPRARQTPRDARDFPGLGTAKPATVFHMLVALRKEMTWHMHIVYASSCCTGIAGVLFLLCIPFRSRVAYFTSKALRALRISKKPLREPSSPSSLGGWLSARLCHFKLPLPEVREGNPVLYAEDPVTVLRNAPKRLEEAWILFVRFYRQRFGKHRTDPCG